MTHPHSIYQQKDNFGIGINPGNVQSGAQVAGIFHVPAPNWVEAAADLQHLLVQLSPASLSSSPLAQIQLATEAIQHIETDPSLKQRLISAAQHGAIVAAAIEGWAAAEA